MPEVGEFGVPLLEREAFARAQALGGVCAKTIALVAGVQPVLVVVPLARKVDLARVAELLSVDPSEVGLASEEELRGIFGFSSMSISVLGCGQPCRVIVDSLLTVASLVYIGSGTMDNVVGISPRTLVEQAGASVASISLEG